LIEKATSAKEPFSGEVAPIASFSAIGFNPAAVRHTFNRLCPSTPAATSISSLAKSIRTDERQMAAGHAYPPI
jgi:hypothetical protein